MLRDGTYDLETGEGLLACPKCDALHIEEELLAGETARCIRCNSLLAKPRTGAFIQIIALSFTTMVLMFGAMFFPFLEISRMGFGNATSLFGVVMAFAHGSLMPLVIVMLGVIVGLPTFRAFLLLYTLLPLAKGLPARRHAAEAFRAAEALRPWSMIEIFVIGTVVALVKIVGMATITLGPAFWAFCGLVLVNVASDVYTCQTTIWDAIEDSGVGTDGRELVNGKRSNSA